MSWLPRLQIALFAVVIAGMLFLIYGHLGSGWSALTYFAWGMIISGGALLLNLVVAGLTAVFQPGLRKVSTWIAAVSLLMLIGLVLLWRVA